LDRTRFVGSASDRRRGSVPAEQPRINDEIRAACIRLVGPDSEQVGVMSVPNALQAAAELGLDLVEVAPMADPPVCKLVDYGKYKYDAGVRAREARRHQHQTTIKAMNFRPKIDSHDFETKKGHVLRFLRAGHKVRVTVWFRGRERFRPELGLRVLTRLIEAIGDAAVVESEPRQDGRNMIMVMSPSKAKGTAP
jgi:translation initiation factor IF-3